MSNPVIRLLKRLKDNYIRNWREMDSFQLYGSIIFTLVVACIVIFTPQDSHRNLSKYLNFLAILFVILMFKRVKKSRREVIEKNKEIELQKQLIEEHQQETIDSITYAKRLQEAILPPASLIKEKFPASFVLYKPKAIVAGDFYWMEQVNDTVLIAAADCTGHGVPGALVSIVCSNALNRTVNEFKLVDTGQILDKVTALVLETFEKSGEEINDGMDISLLAVNKITGSIQWSGANNPLWLISGNELREIKADKQPIGKSGNRKPFTSHRLTAARGDSFYLITDGYADQFGPDDKKLMKRKFKKLITSIQDKAMDEQVKFLDAHHTTWKGSMEQTDDVTVIGIRL